MLVGFHFAGISPVTTWWYTETEKKLNDFLSFTAEKSHLLYQGKTISHFIVENSCCKKEEWTFESIMGVNEPD